MSRCALLRLVVVALLLAVLCGVVPTGHAATNVFFRLGIELSQDGQFPEAVRALRVSSQMQMTSGTLINLGLAEWQSGRAGAAILAWEQAQWLDPFDARAKGNLKFARSAAQVEGLPLKWYEVASTWLPPNAWVWLAGASLWLAVGALVLPRVFRWRKTGWLQTLAALGLGLFLFSLTANIGVVSRTQVGIILKKNASLRLTPTRDGEVITTLNAGEPARRLKTRGNYYFVRTGLGVGWLEQTQFGLICPE